MGCTGLRVLFTIYLKTIYSFFFCVVLLCNQTGFLFRRFVHFSYFRQMQNIVGYLKSACQFSLSASSISSTGSTSSTELAAQKKLGAMNAAKDYLCSNNQVNLKGRNLYSFRVTQGPPV
jgi:hypothetical protein